MGEIVRVWLKKEAEYFAMTFILPFEEYVWLTNVISYGWIGKKSEKE